MRLDAITAEPRPRNAWEATDIGVALVCQWFRPVCAAWFAVALPLFLLLHLLCWGNWWLIPWLLWWLKPLLDRAPLYLLSHALFGDPPDRRQFWRDLPGLLRRQALAALTWRRFDPARSFTLPVQQLEGLSGLDRRRRLRDLSRPGRGPAIWLTVICAHMEIALDLALVTLAWMLVPDVVALEFFDLFDDSDELGQLWLNAVGFCGLSLVEPFYVGAGFALYLNRRTWLEAWDLELGFRRLAARLAGLGRAAAGLAALALGLTLLVVPVAGVAADVPPDSNFPPESAAPGTPSPLVREGESLVKSLCDQQRERKAQLAQAPSPVQRALAETLEEPELQICERQERWRWRGDFPDTPPESGNRDNRLARWFATTVEIALWFGLGLFIAIGGWWLWRQAPRRLATGKPRARTSSIPPILGRHETAVAPEAGLGTHAWRLWNAGQPRAALRLLYLGSLAGLATRHSLPIRASATEDECLRLATTQLADPQLLGFFRRLTRAWQATAYGHRPPDEGAARSLCEEWPRHFAPAGEPPA